MREIITQWTTPSGGGKLSVMYFDDIGSLAAQRAALGTLWNAVDAQLDNAVTWTVRTSGREINPATGGLIGEWTQTTPHTGTGAMVGQCTADTTQILLRWGTAALVNGRFLRGRTFVPGLESNGFTDGNLSAPVQSAMNAAANTFRDAGVGFGVWHRPTGGVGGQFALATTASVWSEAAVLRRRRS